MDLLVRREEQEAPIRYFVLNKETNWILVFFLTAWLIIWLIILGFLTFGLLTTPHRIMDLGLIYLGTVAAGVFFLRVWLWQVRGVERIVAYPGRIDVTRSGSFAFRRPSIAVSELDLIEASEDKETPGWLKWWGLEGGSIRIGFLGRAIRCGQDLDPRHAQILARELNELYHDRLGEFSSAHQ